MRFFRCVLLATFIIPFGIAANLAVATYLRDGFTPAAIASDAQGNLYLAGAAVIDPVSQMMAAAIVKLDPKASQYLYLTHLDSAASDSIAAIAVDSSGNTYVAGTTTNANFPVAGSTALGTAPSTATDSRTFIAKLNPQGAVIFAEFLGGGTPSRAQGIAITSQGRILVSGIATASGFPTTTGAYSVADSTNAWFLMELDAAAGKMIFSATGIGGSSIVLDSAGNIYMAGSSIGTNYPTTPGSYQPALVQGTYCFPLCQISSPGNVQHVTKVDAAASKLIYSTGLGTQGSVTNTGLAIDSAGDAYVTGTMFFGSPSLSPVRGTNTFLVKLDPACANALFSVPIGGGGVAIDSSGAIYVGGIVVAIVNIFDTTPVPASVPAFFSSIPQPCLPNGVTTTMSAYTAKIDPSNGNILDGQWIDGSAPDPVGITLASGKVWMAGATVASDVPITAGALAPQGLGPGFRFGAFLNATDFSGGVNSGPQIDCVLDSGNLSHVSAVTAFQLISLFGTNLGAATPVVAPNISAPSLGGVSINFDSDNPAQLLYVSAAQINLAVPAPLPSRDVVPLPAQTAMQVNANGATISRQFPYTPSNLNLFENMSTIPSACQNISEFFPLVINADGTVNSCTNPAKFGSTVAFFMHGVAAVQIGFSGTPGLPNIRASVGLCSAAVSTSLIDSFVYQLNLTLPAAGSSCVADGDVTQGVTSLPVAFSSDDFPVGPFVLPVEFDGPGLNISPAFGFHPPGQPRQMFVFVR